MVEKDYLISEESTHSLYDYEAFVDSNGDFYLIVGESVVCLTEENATRNFWHFTFYGKHINIESFLERECGSRLIKAFKKEDYTLTISF